MASIDFAKGPGFNNYKRKNSLMDRRFIPRVKEFVEVQKHQPSIEEIVEYLQDSFPEYGRKKKAALRQYVIKALNATDVLSYGRCADRMSEIEDNYLAKRQKRSSAEQKAEEDGSNESDISINDDSEELVDYKDTNIINNSMQNLYKTAANNKDKAASKPPPPPAPVIDLTDNSSEANSQPTPLFKSPSRKNVKKLSKPHITGSPRNVPPLPRRPDAPKQGVHTSGTPSAPRQGLQIFAKSNHVVKDLDEKSMNDTLLMWKAYLRELEVPTKSKINIHSSLLENETHNSQGNDLSVEEKCEEQSSAEPKEKQDTRLAAVATGSVLRNPETNMTIVNKNLISLSEDEKSASSRPSTPLNRIKSRKSRSTDVPSESKKRFEPTESTKSFKDIGGYESCIQEVSKLLFHLKHPEVFTQIGIKPPRGFLLHGPPGCGKTLLANAIAGEMGIPFYKIAATEIVSGISGDSEKRIRSLFAEAVAVAPSILFIDEIDSITPKREDAAKEMERRVVTQILTCMDELDDSQSNVLVIGATNRPDSLDPALRRAGRFDREIAMGIPDRAARKTILKVICGKLRLSADFDYDKIAVKTPGYVGADIEALTREAAMCAVDRAFKSIKQRDDRSSQDFTVSRPTLQTHGETTNLKELDSTAWLRDQPPLSENELSSLYISTEHFENALTNVQPSAKREGFATVPDVTWDDIGALEDIREELTMAIMAPVQNPDEFASLGLITPPGILLCGPPGCGKTLLAKAISNEAGINFISVKGPELMNMYVGESEKAVRQVFQRARSSSPCVIFFDEIDALCPKRSHGDSNVSSRVVNQLLTEMDGLQSRKNVFIMGATNRPDILDGAILRPGRLDKQLYVGLPNATDRAKILRTITKNGTKPTLSDDISVEELALDPRCEGFSGADLGALIREASVAALKEFMRRRSGIIDDEEKEEEEKEYTKMSSDLVNGAGGLPKAIFVSCPSDENSTCSASPYMEETLDKTSSGEAIDVISSTNTDDITSTGEQIDDTPTSVKRGVHDDVAINGDINVENGLSPVENGTSETSAELDGIKPDVEIVKAESTVNENETKADTPMEIIDTISLTTDSPATADFQVGSVDEDDPHIVIDTSSELTNEDAEEAVPSLDAPTEEAKKHSSDVLTDIIDKVEMPPITEVSQTKKIIVTKKHFSLAFTKVQPSVSDKDRVWYEKMKTKNNRR